MDDSWLKGSGEVLLGRQHLSCVLKYRMALLQLGVTGMAPQVVGMA